MPQKDKSKLHKKTITNKRGKRQTVWVKTDVKPAKADKSMTLRKRESEHNRNQIKKIGFKLSKYDDYDYRGRHNGNEIIIESGAVPKSWTFRVNGVRGEEEHDTKLSATFWALAEIDAFDDKPAKTEKPQGIKKVLVIRETSTGINHEYHGKTMKQAIAEAKSKGIKGDIYLQRHIVPHHGIGQVFDREAKIGNISNVTEDDYYSVYDKII